MSKRYLHEIVRRATPNDFALFGIPRSNWVVDLGEFTFENGAKDRMIVGVETRRLGREIVKAIRRGLM